MNFNWIRNLFTKTSKVSGILLSQGSSGEIWTPNDYENFAKETYLKNLIGFRCIDMIAKDTSSVPWKLFKKIKNGKRKEIEDHPINKVINRANPRESFNFTILQAIAYLVMSGNSYLERVRASELSKTNSIEELYTHRPDRITVNADPKTGNISKYVYEVEGRKRDWRVDPVNGKCDLLHLKLFHPTNDWYGAAITESAAREIDTSNEAVKWNKNILENGARPGMVFSIDGSLSQEQFDSLEKQLKERHSGANNAGKNLIIEGEGNTKVSPYGWTPSELDFIQGNRDLARKISIAYGVPPQLVGILGDSTYSNFKEARLNFWESTIFFYLNLLKGELNNWYFEEDENIFLDYLLDDVPALAPRREVIWDRAQSSDFLTINEKREMVGREEIEGGDVLLVPLNLVPLTGDDADEFDDIDEINEEDEIEDEKAILDLMASGYSREESELLIGIPNV